ncbi:Hypp2715 [Branchiostoma lanceolatum]|uniref:Hypp2715 protein n=1 Tax=Branchiostoma lanceolatum TaxID=7740 RepID=A0A8J9ZWH8_BRALA|nr:Hypp2715 [Branchiostoma lanceolatum]
MVRGLGYGINLGSGGGGAMHLTQSPGTISDFTNTWEWTLRLEDRGGYRDEDGLNNAELDLSSRKPASRRPIVDPKDTLDMDYPTLRQQTTSPYV